MRSTWLSSRAILLHFTMILLVATMACLTWWQASRALSGNTLSYVYAFEWPILAGVVVYMWWDMLHDRAGRVGRSRQGGSSAGASMNGSSNGAVAHANGPSKPNQTAPKYRDEEDEELAAYNRYLAELNRSGRRKTWRHPT